MQGTPASIFVRGWFSIPKVPTMPEPPIPEVSHGDGFSVDEETHPTG